MDSSKEDNAGLLDVLAEKLKGVGTPLELMNKRAYAVPPFQIGAEEFSGALVTGDKLIFVRESGHDKRELTELVDHGAFGPRTEMVWRQVMNRLDTQANPENGFDMTLAYVTGGGILLKAGIRVSPEKLTQKSLESYLDKAIQAKTQKPAKPTGRVTF